MALDAHTLHQIYNCTSGYCHRCRRKLAFSKFARQSVRGAWDIDACLRPACGPCLARPTPPVRKARKQDSPPAPPVRRGSPQPPARRRRTGPVCRHTVLGGLLGAFVAGPWGALVGGLLGAVADGGELA